MSGSTRGKDTADRFDAGVSEQSIRKALDYARRLRARTDGDLLDFDADKDGRITRAEVDAGLAAQFAAADKNADGKLDPAEFQRHNDQRRAERKARYEAWQAKQTADGGTPKPFVDRGPRTFDPMKNMDWDLDGYISPEEFSGKTRAQAMRADRDGDGTVLAADLRRSPRKKDTKAQ